MIDAELTWLLGWLLHCQLDLASQQASKSDELSGWQLVIIVPPVLVLERVLVGTGF